MWGDMLGCHFLVSTPSICEVCSYQLTCSKAPFASAASFCSSGHLTILQLVSAESKKLGTLMLLLEFYLASELLKLTMLRLCRLVHLRFHHFKVRKLPCRHPTSSSYNQCLSTLPTVYEDDAHRTTCVLNLAFSREPRHWVPTHERLIKIY